MTWPTTPDEADAIPVPDIPLRRPRRKWGRTVKAVYATLAAAGVWLAAMLASQPSVDVSPLPIAAVGAKEWVVTAAYTSMVDGVRIIVPTGFRCDLASLGPLDKPLGIERDHPTIRRAALLHDWLYATELVSRATADMILHRACIEDGMDPAKARAVYEAVRIWGEQAWDRHTTESIIAARGLMSVEQADRK